MTSRAVLVRIAKNNFTRSLILESKRDEQQLLNNVYSRLYHSSKLSSYVPPVKVKEERTKLMTTSSHVQWSSPTHRLWKDSNAWNASLQRPFYSSNAASENNEKEAKKSTNSDTKDSAKADNEPATTEQGQETDLDMSVDDLAKLLAEREEQLKCKHKEVEAMQDKVLRSYAEMENVIDRTRREAENTKKFAIQNFAKNLLDVADNLGRASSVVKESFSKIDTSKDSAEAVSLLKTLLEGVEMTDKQLSEVFKKFGVEKFDPMDKKFDPNCHQAVFQMHDESKPSGTVAAVIKPGYMLYDRVLRPAEVGVTEGGKVDGSEESSNE